MIDAVAFLPHPPVLVPEVARGAAPELDGLRAACHAALERTGAFGRPVLVGSAPRTRFHDATARGTLAGLGVPYEIGLGSDLPGPVELPLSLTVGAWLVREYLGPDSGATGWSVGAEVPQLPTDGALIVLGDGSARRSTKAPGYLDARAEPHDATVARALAGGDPEALAAVEPDDLLVAGTPSWRAVAHVLRGTSWRAQLLYADAPYGVGYFVATWVR